MQGSNFDLAPHDWATLRGLLDDALELPAGRREAWLQALDSRFEAFKPRLRALLAHVESPLARRDAQHLAQGRDRPVRAAARAPGR